MSEEYDFKRTSAQIETLLDKIPSDGNVAKIYNTTLDVFGIQDGSVVTEEQNTEVINIMDKWNQGYVVTYVDTRQNSFHYGVLNVCRCDDGVPTTLSVVNDRGDLLAYSFEPAGETTWTVTNKTSGSGGESKVYVSPFKFNEVTSGSFLTEAQKSIITDINVNYEKGNIVVMSETSITNFKFGVINFAHSATTGTTLSIINIDGDLIAYHLDGTTVGASRWTVTNKTTGGGGGSGENTLFLTTPYLLDEGGELNASDSAVLNSLKEEEFKNLTITYCSRTGNGTELIPLKVTYDYSQRPFEVTLIHGESFKQVISEDENVVGRYTAEPSIRGYPYKEGLNLSGTFNISDKNYQFNFNAMSPVITGWCIFDGSINFYLEGTAYTCNFSIPMNIYRNRPDRDMYNAMAINVLGTISYPVAITFSSGLVFVKVLTSLNVSKIEMVSPSCRLVRF